jgi:polyhydroxybutyrate depolymerase
VIVRKWGKLCLTAVLVFLPATSQASDVQSKNVSCEGQKSRYELFVPKGEGTKPAILLLHGSGDSPRPMIDAWHSLAKKEGIVLIAPELPLKPEFEAIAPQVFRCEVEDAKRSAAIDARRIYVFGNSMGGYLAYDAAAFDSDYFAGIAVHAMGIDPQYDGILDHAQRKLPIAIYIGDSDQLVSLKNVRRTRDLLQKRGFVVHYIELRDHDHNYYAASDKVNPDAWKFLTGQTAEHS